MAGSIPPWPSGGDLDPATIIPAVRVRGLWPAVPSTSVSLAGADVAAMIGATLAGTLLGFLPGVPAREVLPMSFGPWVRLRFAADPRPR